MVEIAGSNLNLSNSNLDTPKLKKSKLFYSLLILLALASCGKKEMKETEKNFKVPVPAELKWKKLNDLYSYYLWFGGDTITLGRKIIINKNDTLNTWDTIVFKPNDIIKSLYERKFEKIPEGFEVAKRFYDDSISKMNFDNFQASSIWEYKNDIKNSINQVKDTFDRDSFCNEKLWWDKKKLNLFKDICYNIDENSLLAYSMTELFPSPTWEYNQNILEFMLKNGWKNLIYYLPAVNDDYASFGPYQFTSKAIYDAWGELLWASIMNQYLPKEFKIPGSVIKLEWNDHHRAAYLFAMYNLYILLKNQKNLEALKLLSKSEYKSDLTQLIAIMHNKPANWDDFLRERYKLKTDKKYLKKMTLDKKGRVKYKYDMNGNWNIDLYESKLSPSTSHRYWKKTYFNRKIIKG